MAYNGGVISPPVSIYDVQQPCWVRLVRTVSGTTERIYSPSLGVLCGANVGDTVPASDGKGSWTVEARGAINRWARYKPERIDGYRPIMHGSMLSQTRTRKGNNFGLDVPYCITNPNRGWVADVMNGMVWDILNRDYVAWEYLKPRGDRTPQGGVQEYYRLTDFVRIPTDDTDPYYNTVYAKGYNHNARVPFVSWMNQLGVIEKHTAARGTWYECNKQISNALTIVFQNSIGDDLHLQDFINLGTDASGRAWRPVLQVFNDYTPAGGTAWYNRSQPDMEIIGDAITADSGGTIWSVSLPLSSFQDNANAFYHLCIGIGYVNAGGTSWGSGNALFLLPYTEEQDEDGEFPFYYQFSVVSHQERRLNVTALQIFADGLQRWENASGQAPYFTIHSLATDFIGLTITVTKYPNQPLKFVKGTDSTTTNYMKIIAKEMINYQETPKFLTPSVGPSPSGSQSPWAENINGIDIPAGAATETVTLYATLNIGSIPVGGYGEYHLQADTSAGQMDDIGYFSIRKVQYGS